MLFLIKPIANPTSSFKINNYMIFYTVSPPLAKTHKINYNIPMVLTTSLDIHTLTEFLLSRTCYQLLTPATLLVQSNNVWGLSYLIISLPTFILLTVVHSISCSYPCSRCQYLPRSPTSMTCINSNHLLYL